MAKTYKMYLRRCKRCGKIYWTKGRKSRVCAECKRKVKPKWNPKPYWERCLKNE